MYGVEGYVIRMMVQGWRCGVARMLAQGWMLGVHTFDRIEIVQPIDR